ncbi:potassium-transporting ATPase subunit KdpA, partial [Siminovitchia fortis]|uniref:potassium-transporting ATPase subunit KdpA n=1 Tax=Siminovitchia fortis TaxID=254758 RepID=UPI0036F3BE0D
MSVWVIVRVVVVGVGVGERLGCSGRVSRLEGKVERLGLGGVGWVEWIKDLGRKGGGFLGRKSGDRFEKANGLRRVIE